VSQLTSPKKKRKGEGKHAGGNETQPRQEEKKATKRKKNLTEKKKTKQGVDDSDQQQYVEPEDKKSQRPEKKGSASSTWKIRGGSSNSRSRPNAKAWPQPKFNQTKGPLSGRVLGVGPMETRLGSSMGRLTAPENPLESGTRSTVNSDRGAVI